jgi:hypothetical protein
MTTLKDQQKYFDPAERIPYSDLIKLGLSKEEIYLPGGPLVRRNLKDKVKFKPTGEFRTPKKDEWYLSGAIVEAWRAPNDLSQPFYIARPVRVNVEIKTIITEV